MSGFVSGADLSLENVTATAVILYGALAGTD
jgi:hypothetical protein